MNYNKLPILHIDADKTKVHDNYESILEELTQRIKSELIKETCILAVEVYPGVRNDELIPQLKKLQPVKFINMEDVLCNKDEYQKRIHQFLTDDRVFGRMYYGGISDFQEEERLNYYKEIVQNAKGLVIVYGFGAADLVKPDVIVYADMCRWEIQLRFRNGAANFYTNNEDADVLKKFKQGYFFEWRMADRIKRTLHDRLDFYLDTVKKDSPVMITGDIYRKCLNTISKRPFRTVPYFDPGVWGGNWMKSVCGLDPKADNYAWAFDGVPEENSLIFEVAGKTVDIPATNLILYHPEELLGEQVYSRFGAEFPIRFDFLDTVGGQNLSLQVHPTTDYIHYQFGMNYTQDESYYILDAKENSYVYLGLKDETVPDEMIAALHEAQNEGKTFDAEHFVNKFPAKKHDHFLIPAGTVHCSGSGCMVLEISATPYIFTMKLWDWGRLGLDGRPRPIHIDHGSKVIQWDRRTHWVKNNLINRFNILNENHDYTEEHTGLHELEFIETRRINIKGIFTLDTNSNVSMLNLVNGEAAIIESPENAFEPYEVHYAETFIIPASVGKCTIRPYNCSEVTVIRAYVR